MFARLSVVLHLCSFFYFGFAVDPEPPLFEPFVIHLWPSGFYGMAGDFSIGMPTDRPPITLKALFDTGTFHLWTVPPESNIPASTKYGGEGITTYVKTETAISEKFDNEELKGYVSEDTVKVGSGITLENQKFGQLQTTGEETKKNVFQYFDAVFGLDLISKEELISNGMPETPLLRMADKYKDFPPFGIYLTWGGGVDSRLVFGDKDSDMYTGEFSDHPVVKRGGVYRGWNVGIDKIEVEHIDGKGSKTFQGTAHGSQGFSRIISRITTLLLGPKEFMDNLNREIFSRHSTGTMQFDENDLSFPCSNADDWINLFKQLPNLHIYIKKKTNEDSTKYIFRPVDYIAVSDEEDFKCRSTFYGSNIDYFIIGFPFLSKYYTKFDYKNKLVKMAKANLGFDDKHLSEYSPTELDEYTKASKEQDLQRKQRIADAKTYYGKDKLTSDEFQSYQKKKEAALNHFRQTDPNLKDVTVQKVIEYRDTITNSQIKLPPTGR